MNTDTDDMALLIPTILRTAAKTFTCNPEIFSKNLEQLSKLFNNIKSAHVNLNPVLLNKTTWESETKAPMTYVHIFNDDIINVGIFILKPKMKLPLHNHPDMYGLLKVIAGTVKITSYSLNTENTKKYVTIQEDEGTSSQDDNGQMKLIAEQMDDIIADSETNCCVLDPNKSNIHEIESLNGPAAFIDILSPPYDVDIPGVGERKCSYFKLEKELEPKIFELQEINTPSWFWSDSFPYTGPTFHSRGSLPNVLKL